MNVKSMTRSFGAERVVVQNTSKLLLEIKSFTKHKVIYVRLSTKALHTLIQPSFEIHIYVTDSAMGQTCDFTFVLTCPSPSARTLTTAQCLHVISYSKSFVTELLLKTVSSNS